MRVFQESERKYDVDPAYSVPELGDLPGVAGVSPAEEIHLEAVYFDTADLRLLGAGITLRRRTGGSDAGWHLKRPVASHVNGNGTHTRTEVHHPLGRATRTVPAPLAELVRVHVRGNKLIPVGRIATTRTTYNLLDADGAVLAELSDDDVSAQRLQGTRGQSVDVTSWREVEVELKAGEPALLDAVAARLRLTGARPSGSGSKLARVLATASPAEADQTDAESRTAARPAKSSAGAAVVTAIRAQVETIKHWDPAVRRDEPDAVHQMRVASRRLRSILGGYRLILDREATDPIREELKWLGSELGAARDTEVMHQRLRRMIEQRPPELILGPVAARVDSTLVARYHEAHERVLGVLDQPRYLQLLDTLDALVAEPPFTDAAEQKAKRTLPMSVHHAWKRLARRADAANSADSPEQRDLLLHEVRKGAKQARYVSEVAQPVHGSDAKRFTKAMKDVQQILGDHQDTVVTREELRTLGAQAHLAGENGFTFGLLYAAEEANADGSDRAFTEAWSAANRSELHAWLK